jgi:hypothetical protein
MKKLSIVILLSAAGITGAAFAQTSYGGSNGSATGNIVKEDPGSYGKVAGPEGSRVSPTYGKKGTTGTNGSSMGTNGSSMGTDGSSMGTTTSGQVMWTCPSGYTLSTATRDGSPLCYPSSGPVPGVSR